MPLSTLFWELKRVVLKVTKMINDPAWWIIQSIIHLSFPMAGAWFNFGYLLVCPNILRCTVYSITICIVPHGKCDRGEHTWLTCPSYHRLPLSCRSKRSWGTYTGATWQIDPEVREASNQSPVLSWHTFTMNVSVEQMQILLRMCLAGGRGYDRSISMRMARGQRHSTLLQHPHNPGASLFWTLLEHIQGHTWCYLIFGGFMVTT